jgi:probable HAF family extracellular repeat protein
MVSLGSDTIGAEGVSADGSVVVGTMKADIFDYRNSNEAFRWTQMYGLVRLGTLGNCGDEGCHSHAPRYFSSSATAVSADGSVIIGDSDALNGLSEGFRWTQSKGMVNLHNLHPSDVSADGSKIVGTIWGNGQVEAFRSTSYDVIRLGFLSGTNSSLATAVSADGSIIVGASGSEAFHWTQGGGMVSLKETLIGAGLDVSGWNLYSARGVSADGFTIVGNGINPSGQSEAWIANLSPEPVPEPLTILGSIAAIAFAAGFERKFNKNKSDEKDPDA